jgi:hypothetical protein
MKILVIGGGWYGCHLTSVLLKQGHKCTIVDKSNALFSGSSSKNQNRLHLGYHYPRSPETIIECKTGYSQFIEQYGDLAESIPNNCYFISDTDSHTTFDKFVTLFDDIELQPNSKFILPITNVGTHNIIVKERFINPFKAKEYFQKLLTPYLHILDNPQEQTKTIESLVSATQNGPYDLILNCTYNHLAPIEYDYYEIFVSLIYKITEVNLFACTIMDGPFFSIYPYKPEEQLYTVTSVKHGVVWKGREIPENFIPNIQQIQTDMENDILKYIPSWESISQYSHYFMSYKTKPQTISDDRSLRYKIDNNIIHFYGGKITGIFEAERVVYEKINGMSI